MEDMKLIKLNTECLACKRLENNGGQCSGRTSHKAPCMAFQGRG